MDEGKLEPCFKRALHGEVSFSVVQDVLHSRVPQATTDSNTFGIRAFEDFCKEKNIALDSKMCSPRELNGALCSFYVGLRTEAGAFSQTARSTTSQSTSVRLTVRLVEASRPRKRIFFKTFPASDSFLCIFCFSFLEKGSFYWPINE